MKKNMKKLLLLLFMSLFFISSYPQYSISTSPPHLLKRVEGYKLVKSNIELTITKKLNNIFTLESKFKYSYLTYKNIIELNCKITLLSSYNNKLKFYNVVATQYINTEITQYPIGFKLSYELFEGVKISADVGITNFVFNNPHYLNIKTTYTIWKN